MSDENDSDYAQPVDVAFTGSDNHALGDLSLQPYTPARKVAAQAIGLKHPNIGDDGLEEFDKTGIYPGALSDTLIVLWLCTLDEREVMPAMRKPDDSLRRAIEWGAERGITRAGGEAFWKAYNKFVDIIAEVHASTSTPQTGRDHEGTSSPKA